MSQRKSTRKIHRRTLRIGALVLCLVAAGGVGPIATSSAQAEVAIPSGCGEVFFLGARGSGQFQDSADGFGPEVYQLYQKVKAGLGDRHVEAEALVYPAEDVKVLIPSPAQFAALGAALAARGPLRDPALAAFSADYRVTNLAQYLGGLQVGVDTAYTALTLRAKSCPRERLVLAGYSQGAMVIHRLLNRLKDSEKTILSRIDGVGLVADGDRVSDTVAPFVFGRPAASPAGAGIATYFHNYNRDVPEELKYQTVNICDKNDLVCDFRGLRDLNPWEAARGVGIHEGYTNSSGLDQAAELLAAQVMRVPVPRVPNPVVGTAGQPLSLQLNASIVQGATLEWRVPSPYYLPDGLTLTTAGLMNGTPTSANNGTTRVAVRAKYRGKFSPWISTDLTWAIAATTPPPSPDDPPTGPVTLVSATASGVPATGTWFPDTTFAPDGKRVAFNATSRELAADARESVFQVVEKDLTTGAVRQISIAANGTSPDGDSSGAIYSPDGKKVAFKSWALNLLPQPAPPLDGGCDRVYIKDLTTGAVTLAASTDDGTTDFYTCDDNYPWYSFSPDSSELLFASSANLLSDAGPAAGMHVYIKSLATGALRLISTEPLDYRTNCPDSGGGYTPAYSHDGNKVVFMSGCRNLYIADLATNTVKPIMPLTYTEGHGYQPVFSPDDSRVAFLSFTPDLIPGSADPGTQVYEVELANGVVRGVSTTATGEPALGGLGAPAGANDYYLPQYAPDGRIAFTASAENLAPPTVPYSRAVYRCFVKNMKTGAIEAIGTFYDPDGNPMIPGGCQQMSPDGTKIAVRFAWQGDFGAKLYVYDFVSRTLTLVDSTPNGTRSNSTDSWAWAFGGNAFSPDSKQLAFAADGTDLLPTPLPTGYKIFVRRP